MNRSGLTRIAVVAAIVLCAVALTACGNKKSSESIKGGPGTVAIDGFAYKPESLKAKVGDKVTWTNKDSAPHSVTSDDDKFPTHDRLAKGESYENTFQAAGEYKYHCSFHNYMKGTVTVS